MAQFWTIMPSSGFIVGAVAPELGSAVQVQAQTFASGQLWQYTANGNLLSALNANWALAATSSGGAVLAEFDPSDPYQIWTMTSYDGPVPLFNLGYSQSVQPRPAQALTYVSGSDTPLSQSAYAEGHSGQQFNVKVGFQSDDDMLVTVTNGTPNDLAISGYVIYGTTSIGTVPIPFAAGAVLTFWSYYQDGLKTAVQIWEPGDYTASVASFVVDLNALNQTAIDSPYGIKGYAIASAQSTDPPDSSSPALAAVTIGYSAPAA